MGEAGYYSGVAFDSGTLVRGLRKKARTLLGLGAAFACLTLLTPPPAATSNFTFYVDINSPATSDCTPQSNATCTGSCAVPACGTQATPCHTIQQAINIANCTIGTNGALEADIVVAAGTYPQRASIFPNIHVIGAGRDVTTIDARGFNRSAVILAQFTGYGFNRQEIKHSITGFRIIHGSGDLITLSDSGGNLYYEIGGGGVLAYGDGTPGWPSVTNCRIEDNTLANLAGTAPDWMGAGIYIARGAPMISGNIIQRNTTTPPDQSGQVTANGWGGGIFSLNFDCSPVITHNTIRNNVTVAQAGNGAGMYIDGSPGTVLSNNLVVANSASIEGGGMYIYGNGVSAYNNVLMGNTGGNSGGGFDLGAPTSDIFVTNNTVVGNVLTTHVTKAPFDTGGGVYAGWIVPLAQQANPLVHLTNNLIAQNDATSTGLGGGLYSYQAYMTDDHLDLYGDRPNEVGAKAGSTDPNLSPGTVFGVNGNVNLNPVFANAPTFWDHTNAAGTSNTAVVFDVTRYAVGNQIEYNDDGVARQITTITSNTKTLTFTPALAYKVCSNAVNASCATNADCASPGTCNTATTQADRILANWGSSTNVTENLRLTASSPVIDLGTNTPLFGTVPTTDFDDLPRPVDGDQNGSAIIDIGAFEFRFPDSDGDGVPDNLDCAPLVNSVWAIPDQVPNPLAISSGQVLSWYRIPQSNVYNVYSGTVVSPWTYAPACLVPEVPGLSTSINVGSPPALGQGFYYLVGGVNACGSGPLHSNATVNASTACPAQNRDTDLDGVLDLNDDCPTVYNPTQDDPDHDTVGTACDNCPAVYNPDQADPDGDGIGSACDNCPNLYNPDQTDVNHNGIGDACEDKDGDGYPLTVDCDDTNPAIHPGAVEVCNGVDDNCNGQIDEGGDALCADTNVCTQDLCGGVLGCQHPAVSDGTACNDGNACTQTDTYQAGICTGSNPVICTAPNACYDPGTCDTGTGLCSAATPKTNGTACDDGNACTVGDTCQSGTCTAGGLRDADGDLHPDYLCGGDDCNDSNPLVWHAPGEVTNLTLTLPDPANPAWDSQSVTAGPETTYDLVSGPFSSSVGISFSSAVCLQSAQSGTSYSDSRTTPALGDGFWYLARARNSCGVSTYGDANRDATIPPCP